VGDSGYSTKAGTWLWIELCSEALVLQSKGRLRLLPHIWYLESQDTSGYMVAKPAIHRFLLLCAYAYSSDS
jgi:hypothetical protein